MICTIKNTISFGNFKIGSKIKALPSSNSQYYITNYNLKYTGIVTSLYILSGKLMLRTEEGYEVDSKYFEVVNDES